METIFPTETGFQGFFMIGFRKNGGATQRTGTVILKRTYDIDGGGVLTPAADFLPVFMQDVPANTLTNSDFELDADFQPTNNANPPGGWTATNVTAARAAAQGQSGSRALSLTGSNTAGQVAQTITFPEPVGGRAFRLSFYVKTDLGAMPARIENARLEAEGQSLCVINRDLSDSLVRRHTTGTWSADLTATEMDVILPIAFDPDTPGNTRIAYYDRVQVQEGSALTEWNDNSTLRYEHDLAPDKPAADLIVLGFATVTGLCRLLVDGTARLSRNVTSSDQKALFGWEPRVNSPREAEAGGFTDDPNNLPPEWPITNPARDPLPAAFNNRFYNGYRRDAGAPPPHPPAAAHIQIERDGTMDYDFTLPGETINATLYTHTGDRPDAANRWHRQPIPMTLDTLVIEPDDDRCTCVWRGLWDYDAHPPDAYRRLLVTAN
ncbi:MAG: DUF2169 domain-containing protein [Ardenticatenales bacterium]|nr:DUF2169 domain-containing protein [Ardenticatenales bacterium]